MRLVVLLAVVAMALCTQRCLAGTLSFRHGSLSLDFDDSTGGLLAIRHGDRVLARGNSGVFPITFATGPADKPVWIDSTGARPQLIGHVQPAPDTLELTITAGDYELVETYKLYAEPARLDRSLRLTYRGQEPVKLRDMYFRTAGITAPSGGFARFPGAWPPVGYAFANMKAGTWRGATGSIAPAGLQIADDLTLLFASYTQDSPSLAMIEGQGTEGAVEIRQSIAAQGFLKPGVAQEIGFVSMQIVLAGYWDSLPRLWDWMDSVGLKVPADRPEWVNGAVLYGFHPGGTIGSLFKDLGGFEPAAQRLLPDLPRLGVTGLWVLPIESESPYWPKDYYRLMEGIGTFEQYKAMVAKAHELKLHVLQDLVPHGGSPRSVHNIAHPEFMLRKEDGSTFDYWLNDFGNPDWQKYIADVARHYVKDFDVDGYRIDACYGSKEPNWSPTIPYARASLAGLQGGLGMISGIRSAVRELKPRDGATLAEVESARHAAVSDIQYDFSLCYNILQQWGKMPPADFAAQLQDYLEERKYAYPRGTLFLRHVESHDSLRSEMWYGIGGMHAMYALTAWIDGVPLIYQNMDLGHSDALAQINAVRAGHPEIGCGEAIYRAVECDRPGVFTCLRKLGEKSSVIAINFTREPVKAQLTWQGGLAAVELPPLGYTTVSGDKPAVAPKPVVVHRSVAVATEELPDVYPLAGATEWFIDTIEGRLQNRFDGVRTSGVTSARDGIYWRDQVPSLIWRGDMLPLDPVQPQIGYRAANGTWRIILFANADSTLLRMVERHDGKEGLFLLGGKAKTATPLGSQGNPPTRDVTQAAQLGSIQFRCVGNEIILSNAHYTLTLRKQGGLVRQLATAGMTIRSAHDLYGDQKAFATGTSTTINASADAEGAMRIWLEGSDVHMRFEGQLRGMDRFALKNPPPWYYNEYVFSDAKTFQNYWGFKSDGEIAKQTAFLTFLLPSPGGDTFRFGRNGSVVAEGQYKPESGRQAQTGGTPLPDRVDFLQGGKRLWSLTHIQCSDGIAPNLFVDGQNLFLTLLDGLGAAMEKGRWYEFSSTWEP